VDTPVLSAKGGRIPFELFGRQNKMNVPEWVPVVSHGTPEEVAEFIDKNPGHDWNTEKFADFSFIPYVMRHNPFPMTVLNLLFDRGRASVNSSCVGTNIMLPLEYAIENGGEWAMGMLFARGAIVRKPRYLTLGPIIRHRILTESTALSPTLVNEALFTLQNETRRDPRWVATRAELMGWLVSHGKRRETATYTAWLLSQLPGQWPDMSETVARILMQTRVVDW
jgi:hypothetical protein